MSFLLRRRGTRPAERSGSGRFEEKGSPPGSLKNSPKSKRQQSAYFDEKRGLWKCRRCEWTYPNPHPSARQRREHKKHCEDTQSVHHWLGGVHHDHDHHDEHHHHRDEHHHHRDEHHHHRDEHHHHHHHGEIGEIRELRDDSKASQKTTFLERLNTPTADQPVPTLEKENDGNRVFQNQSNELKVKAPSKWDLKSTGDVDKRISLGEAGDLVEVEDENAQKESEVQDVANVKLYSSGERSESGHDILATEGEILLPEEEKFDSVLVSEEAQDDGHQSLFADDDATKEKAQTVDIKTREPFIIDEEILKEKAETVEEAAGTNLDLTAVDDVQETKVESPKESERTQHNLTADDHMLKEKREGLKGEECDLDLIADFALVEKVQTGEDVEESAPNLTTDECAVTDKIEALDQSEESTPHNITDHHGLRKVDSLENAMNKTVDDAVKHPTEVVEDATSEIDDDAVNLNAESVEDVKHSELSLSAIDPLKQNTEFLEGVKSEKELLADDEVLKEQANEVGETEGRGRDFQLDEDALEEQTGKNERALRVTEGNLAMETKGDVAEEDHEMEPSLTVDDLLRDKEVEAGEVSLGADIEALEEKGEGLGEVENEKSNQSLEITAVETEDEVSQSAASHDDLDYVEPRAGDITSTILETCDIGNQTETGIPYFKDDDMMGDGGKGRLLGDPHSTAAENDFETEKKLEEKELPATNEQPQSVCSDYVPADLGVSPQLSLEVEVSGKKSFEEHKDVKISDQEKGREVVGKTIPASQQETGQSSRVRLNLSPAESNWDDWDEVLKSTYTINEDGQKQLFQKGERLRLSFSGDEQSNLKPPGAEIGDVVSKLVEENNLKTDAVLGPECPMGNEIKIEDSDLTVATVEGDGIDGGLAQTSNKISVDDISRTKKDLEDRVVGGPDRKQADVIMDLVNATSVSDVLPHTSVEVKVPGTKLVEKLEHPEAVDDEPNVEQLSIPFPEEHDRKRRVLPSLSSAEANWDDWEDVVRSGCMLTEGGGSSSFQEVGHPQPLLSRIGQVSQGELDYLGPEEEKKDVILKPEDGQVSQGQLDYLRSGEEKEDVILKPEDGKELVAKIKSPGLETGVTDSKSVDIKVVEVSSSPSLESQSKTAKDHEGKELEDSSHEVLSIPTVLVLKPSGRVADSSPQMNLEVEVPKIESNLVEGLDQKGTKTSEDDPGQARRVLISKLSSAVRNWEDWDEVVTSEHMLVEGRRSLFSGEHSDAEVGGVSVHEQTGEVLESEGVAEDQTLMKVPPVKVDAVDDESAKSIEVSSSSSMGDLSRLADGMQVEFEVPFRKNQNDEKETSVYIPG